MLIGNYLSFEKCLCGLQPNWAGNNKLFNKDKMKWINKRQKMCQKSIHKLSM